MSDRKIIAVVGATGAQAGGLARAILNDPDGEFAVRALTRNPQSDNAQALAGRGAEVVVYPDAGHAFFNDTRPEAYQQAAADGAWRRTVELFEQHLRS